MDPFYMAQRRLERLQLDTLPFTRSAPDSLRDRMLKAIRDQIQPNLNRALLSKVTKPYVVATDIDQDLYE